MNPLYSDCCNSVVDAEDYPNPGAETGVSRMFNCRKCGNACTVHEAPVHASPVDQSITFAAGGTGPTGPEESPLTRIPFNELFGQKLLVMFEVLPLSDRYQQLMLTEPEARAFNGFIKAVFERRQEPLRPPSPPFPPGAFCPITHPAYDATFPNASDCYTPEEILERLEDGPSYRPGDSAGDAVV